MKFLLLIGLLCFNCLVFSQESLSNADSFRSQNPDFFKKSDTTFYNNGVIKCIVFQSDNRFSIGNNLLASFEVQKKIYQYDACGNLRNITEVSKYIGPIQSCHDYYFTNPFRVQEYLIPDSDCEIAWNKTHFHF